MRGREWVILPEVREQVLRLRPMGGAEEDATLIYLPVEPSPPKSATFAPPDPSQRGTLAEATLLRDAIVLNLRTGAGPFRSFGSINVEPRAYQLVPLLMALKLDPIRLLIADDVGVGKTIEAGLIAKEMLYRGEINGLSVICPPHLCDQWQRELSEKFNIDVVVVRTGTAARLERKLLPGESVFDTYPFTVVSLDYIKVEKRREDFIRRCPQFVIVDEAHTCVATNTKTRHLRYRLVRQLADSKDRHMLFLTATPHSGKDHAFYNLLGLIDKSFRYLLDLEDLAERQRLRSRLRSHFVQRRRGNIEEWEDKTQFPRRLNREVTYSLTGKWAEIFNDILAYARGMIRLARGKTEQQRRMSWWAALALLRSVSSSPEAALAALRNRLSEPEGDNEKARLARINKEGNQTVMDEIDSDEISTLDVNPPGTIRDKDDDEVLRFLIEEVEQLRGPEHDPKIKTLIREVRKLIREGFSPVIFCRFIATAGYVGAQLRQKLPKTKTKVEVVTGELTSDQREETVAELGKFEKGTPVLVATDCLSEGINLQEHFDAVIHYDLAWNPTRHEQREGRVDRFGQRRPEVRTMMLYGKNNPIDGNILEVILRKAEKIRKELGVAVPIPIEMSKVVDAIIESLLFKGSDITISNEQIEIFETEWKTANRKAARTIFVQARLKPQEALEEWKKTRAILGGEEDVRRFVSSTALHLKAGLAEHDGYNRLPVKHFPAPLQDRLSTIGIYEKTRIRFSQPPPPGGIHIHRAHPLVSTLADYVTEQALDGGEVGIGARATAIRTKGVTVRTVLYLIRLRSQIIVESWVGGNKFENVRTLLAEECLGVEVKGSGNPQVLSSAETLESFRRVPHVNLNPEHQTHLIRRAVEESEQLQDAFEKIAYERAKVVEQDHKRVRQASNVTRIRSRVEPSIPVDILGVYVFLPVPRGFGLA